MELKYKSYQSELIHIVEVHKHIELYTYGNVD